MRKLKYQAYCQQCRAEGHKVPALWRSNGMSANMRMCDQHKHLIKQAEDAERARDNGHMSEADEQTWGRL